MKRNKYGSTYGPKGEMSVQLQAAHGFKKLEERIAQIAAVKAMSWPYMMFDEITDFADGSDEWFFCEAIRETGLGVGWLANWPGIKMAENRAQHWALKNKHWRRMWALYQTKRLTR